eukprot:4433763-Prymnesium_polylepis.1
MHDAGGLLDGEEDEAAAELGGGLRQPERHALEVRHAGAVAAARDARLGHDRLEKVAREAEASALDGGLEEVDGGVVAVALVRQRREVVLRREHRAH